MASQAPTREELKARLRAKTNAAKQRRVGGETSGGGASDSTAGPDVNNMRSAKAKGNLDIASLMMSMGIDDPALLKQIGSQKNGDPKAVMAALTSYIGKQMQETKSGSDQDRVVDSGKEGIDSLLQVPTDSTKCESDEEAVPDIL